MRLRLRPRAISPTSTTTLPVPISTAPTTLLLLEITFRFALQVGKLKDGGRRGGGEFGRRLLEEDGDLPLQREVDRLQDGLRRDARPVEDEIELGDLLEKIAAA